MRMAGLTRERSTCLRRKVGAILVRDHFVLSTGYNGAPKGLPHCEETGCVRDQKNIPSGQMHELCRGVHAEQNAIVQAAVSGVSVAGASLYTTSFPCVICAKLLINARIREVVYEGHYEDPLSKKLLADSLTAVRRFPAK